jgi:hypothetical protein
MESERKAHLPFLLLTEHGTRFLPHMQYSTSFQILTCVIISTHQILHLKDPIFLTGPSATKAFIIFQLRA